MTKLFAGISRIFKYSYRLYSVSSIESHFIFKKPPWKVLFFGSDEFSLYSLKALFNEYQKRMGHLSLLEVVTCSKLNPIWKFSNEQKLTIHKWPPELRRCDFDLGIVVSFGNLIPEHIINKFPLGMLNVHASLLPRWRGASPIVYALAKGDKETGVTIMRIRPKIFDVGEILYQKGISIPDDIEMPELHEQLGKLGALYLMETIQNLEDRLVHCKPQSKEGVTYAPKITPDFCQINWSTLTAKQVHNLQRALKTVQPLRATWNTISVKLLDIAVFEDERSSKMPGFVEYSRKNKSLIIECANKTWISVKKVGIQGKKIMNAADFYNGFISKLDKNTIACFR